MPVLLEQRELEANSMGSCMEYLINHQVLDILSSLAQADTPPGIRPYLINFFIFMLTKGMHCEMVASVLTCASGMVASKLDFTP